MIFIIQEKISNGNYVDIQESNDLDFIIKILDYYRDKYNNHLYRLIEVVK